MKPTSSFFSMSKINNYQVKKFISDNLQVKCAKNTTSQYILNWCIIYAIQFQEESKDLYWRNQATSAQTAQHGGATSSGRDSAVHQHLKETGHSFEDTRVCEPEKIAGLRGVSEPSMSSWKNHIWAEVVDWDISCHPHTTQTFTPSVNNPNVHTFQQHPGTQ